MNNESLLEFVFRFRDAATNRQEKYVLGEVFEEENATLFALTGVEVIGFRRIADNFGVRHAFKKHGNPTIEEPRGQAAILPEDFEQINSIVVAAEKVVVELGKKGLFIIRYEKTIENFLLIYAEEIRIGQRELAFQTLYKRKIRKP
ncbi:MAG: hypothetical protein H7246_07365 [Phycisphaerae bacterium]|nr:hypothetical protein [Saprospiraceae bacterium]